MLKKPNLLCCGGLQLLSPSASSPHPSRAHCGRYYSPHSSSYRAYTTAHGFSDHADLSWPSSSSFTPYDVFKQDRGAPYSKTRFYELVKIYHPDRPCNGHPLCRDLSPQVRLQRYHAVVAANEILSDPTKRDEYDRFGTGWSFDSTTKYGPMPSWSRGDTGPIWANATWEDWERWHNRHNGKQEQMVDHRTFVTFVLLLVMFGGSLQASWISQLNTGYEDRLKAVNEESTRFLKGRRESTVTQMGSNEAKVQHFLIRRDPTGSGLKEEEQGVYQNILYPRKSREAPDEARAEPAVAQSDKRGQTGPAQPS